MARHLRNGRSKFAPGDRFIMVPHWHLDCEAWRSLTTQARAVYIELERRYNGFNNGEIALSVREASRLCNIAKSTAQRALGELQEKGFIGIETPGGFDYKVRHATEYRLTAHPYRGQPATKDFMRWQPKNL